MHIHEYAYDGYCRVMKTKELMMAERMGHIFRRDCLLTHVIEENIKGSDDVEEDVSNYWKTREKKLKEEALDRTIWRKSIWKSVWTHRGKQYGVNNEELNWFHYPLES